MGKQSIKIFQFLVQIWYCCKIQKPFFFRGEIEIENSCNFPRFSFADKLFSVNYWTNCITNITLAKAAIYGCDKRAYTHKPYTPGVIHVFTWNAWKIYHHYIHSTHTHNANFITHPIFDALRFLSGARSLSLRCVCMHASIYVDVDVYVNPGIYGVLYEYLSHINSFRSFFPFTSPSASHIHTLTHTCIAACSRNTTISKQKLWFQMRPRLLNHV